MEDNGTVNNGNSGDERQGRPGSSQIVAAIFNGLGVGLLLGILLGLSISPVVSGVIGTVTSLLALMLGLNEKFISMLKGMRIGAFGLFAVAGILLGIFIRSNNVFSPSLAELKSRYIEIGYTEEEALDFISLQEFDLVPAEWKGGEVGQKVIIDSSTVAGKRRSNILFSSTVDIGQCYLVESVSRDMPLSEILNTFSMAGKTWKQLAESLPGNLSEQAMKGALLAYRDTFCGYGSSGTVEVAHCDLANAVDQTQSLEDYKAALSSTGEVVHQLVMNLEKQTDPADQKSILISAISVLCYEK